MAMQHRDDTLVEVARVVAERLVRDPARRAEQLGEIYLACREVASESTASAALPVPETPPERLAEHLLPGVRERLSKSNGGSRGGGWLGTYIDPAGRAIESQEADTTDRAALELSLRALRRAHSRARAEGNETLQRNLRWYEARLAHRSYDAIAREEGRVPATIRTGVARARKFVLRVVHELQHGQPAPLSGEAPPELEPLRKLWFDQDLVALERELERTRSANPHNPHWLNLAGLLAADRGRRAEAVQYYQRGLIEADAPSVRGRLLNNLGNLMDDHDCPEEARGYWLRARQLVPSAPAPLLNLVGWASQREDYASAQHYLAELAELLSSGKLSRAERRYVRRRLSENPKLAWLRDTDAWASGPARWLRGERRERARSRLPTALSLALLILLGAWLWPGDAQALTRPPEPHALTTRADTGDWLVKRSGRGRGGNSMGKPASRFEVHDLVAGDTMGFTSRPGGKKPSKPRR